jgi:hypothetical protein
VDAFVEALTDRVPENTLLSHDLFEGLYARTALVTDIELGRRLPSSVLAHAKAPAPLGARRLANHVVVLPFVPARGGWRAQPPAADHRRWKCSTTCAQPDGARDRWPSIAGWTVLPGRPIGWTWSAGRAGFRSSMRAADVWSRRRSAVAVARQPSTMFDWPRLRTCSRRRFFASRPTTCCTAIVVTLVRVGLTHERSAGMGARAATNRPRRLALRSRARSPGT